MISKTAWQNVTISISPDTVRILAAKRSTSISALLAEQIEVLIGEEEAWDRSQRGFGGRSKPANEGRLKTGQRGQAGH